MQFGLILEIGTYALYIVHNIMFFAKLFRKNVEKGLDGKDRQKLCSFLLRKTMKKFAFGRETDLIIIEAIFLPLTQTASRYRPEKLMQFG